MTKAISKDSNLMRTVYRTFSHQVVAVTLMQQLFVFPGDQHGYFRRKREKHKMEFIEIFILTVLERISGNFISIYESLHRKLALTRAAMSRAATSRRTRELLVK